MLLFAFFSFSSCGIQHENDVHNSDTFIASSEISSSTTKYDNENTPTYQASSSNITTATDLTVPESVSTTTAYIDENTNLLPYDNNEVSITEEPYINTDDLCMTIVCNYPNSQNEYSYYILCVSLNGDVWGTTYSLNTDGSDKNKFFYKLYTCDESVWTYVSKTNYIGRLELNNVEFLAESVSSIYLNSECYTRENDIAPEVIDNVYYTIYCYVPTENEEQKSFHVKSYGDSTGCSYETMDVNAISILQMIQKSELYEIWIESHITIQ